MKSKGVEALILLGSGEDFGGPCFTGVLALSCFLSVTIWVTSLGPVREAEFFAVLLFYPMFSGSPNGSLRLRPPTRTHRCA